MRYSTSLRDYLLRRLLETQREVRAKAPDELKNIELISMDELTEIRRIWVQDKKEFDDSLPRIYEEVTGQIFSDLNQYDRILGEIEWKLLEDVCPNNMMFELVRNVLDIEEKYLFKPNQRGLHDELKKCLMGTFESKEDAINQARYEYHLKRAIKEGNTDAIESITEKWRGQVNEIEEIAVQLKIKDLFDTVEPKTNRSPVPEKFNRISKIQGEISVQLEIENLSDSIYLNDTSIELSEIELSDQENTEKVLSDIMNRTDVVSEAITEKSSWGDIKFQSLKSKD